ncbi:MAG: coiled coil domain-containing protein [Oleiphilaceae bacterium]|nr:coiled coil domain-containing protein [Oleiphilaceae bacterium]
MKDKEIYQRKIQAQLDEWRADIDKLKARASGAGADSQLEINKNLRILESKVEEGKEKFLEISRYGEAAWDSASESVRSGWESVKSEANDALTKLKR